LAIFALVIYGNLVDGNLVYYHSQMGQLSPACLVAVWDYLYYAIVPILRLIIIFLFPFITLK